MRGLSILVCLGLLALPGYVGGQVLYGTNNTDITIANNTLVTLPDSLFLENGSDITIEGTLRVGAGIRLAGTSQYLGLATPTDSLILNGVGRQILTLASSTVFGTLVVEKPGGSVGIRPGSQVSVFSDLSMLQGVINTTPGPLASLTLLPDAIVSQAGATSYVQGPLRLERDNLSPLSVLLPLGTGTDYTPLEYEGTSTFQAVVNAVEAPFAPTPPVGQRFRNLDDTGYWSVLVAGGQINTSSIFRGGYGLSAVPPAFPALGLSTAARPLASGAYNKLPGFATVLFPANLGGNTAVSGTLSTDLTANANPYYLVTGTSKVDPTTLTYGASVIPGELSGAALPTAIYSDVGPGLLFTLQSGASPVFNNVSGAVAVNTADFTSALLNDTVFTNREYRVITSTSEPFTEADTSAPAALTVLPTVQLSLRLFMQGAYTGGTQMRTSNLYSTSLLKTTYTTAATNPLFPSFAPYSDIVALGRVYNPPTGAVDAVQVNLLDGGGTVVASAAAWVLSSGFLADFETGSIERPLLYFNAPAGTYTVQVTHRNHLPLWSQPVTIPATDAPVALDLTQEANVFSPLAPIQYGGFRFGNGRIAMYFGNVAERATEPATLVGITNAFDYSTTLAQGIMAPAGFFRQDINLDGVVNATDFSLIQINTNRVFSAVAP